MSEAHLRVLSGKHSGSTIPLPVGKFLVGREEDCHLRPNSDLISRHHCVFVLDDYGLRLRDLGSTNGSFVNGERLQGSVLLSSGDRVSFGKLDFEVVVGDPTAEDTQSNIDAVSKTELIEGGAPDDDSQLLAEMLQEFGESQEDVKASAADTMINIPVQTPPGFEGQAPPQTGDTQYAFPGMMPQMPPGYPNMMMYPQMMMPYGYPQYPQMGYPQQPIAYPPGYPQAYMQPPMQEQAPPAPGKVEEPAVRLPDPSQTGVKPPAPAAPSSSSEGKSAEAKAKEEAPSAAAAAIQQYLQRRPSTGNK